MITEIFIEGQRLDLTDDISSLITFAIDDVKDFASRQTTFSQTVVLPGTANNNSIFGNIFDTGISNDYDPNFDNIGFNFNPSVSAPCIIYQDNLQTFKGTLRLIEIDIDKRRVEYQVALNGNLTNLNVALSSGYLTDLDFSAYNLPYDVSHIIGSWDNPGGSGVYFPMIDYGNYSTDKKNWDYHTFRPALYVKEYIDKMFAAAGFKYSCDLFNTPRFKSLIVPHNQKVLQSLVSQVASAQITTSHPAIDTTHGDPTSTVQWDAIIAGGFSYVSGVFTYTQPTSIISTISWKLTGTRISTTTSNFNINVRRNGAVVATINIPTTPHISFWSWTSAVVVPINTGDTVSFDFAYGGTGTGVVVTIDNSAPGYSSFTMGAGSPVLQPVDYAQTITLNDTLPQNIRQVDFLTSIVQLFNLYITEDQFDETLMHISPFINFYSPSSTATVDWTYKLDRNGPISIKPLSEVNSKLYNFNYASDSDYWNDLYNKRYNQVYGSFIYDSQFEFADQTNTVTLVFAPTPLLGYDGEEKVYPTIFKRTGDVTGEGEEQVDSVIRIMQSGKQLGVPVWQITNGGTVLASTSAYGYAGHYDNPDSPTNDLNFGALNELFFVLIGGDLTKTQFNVYWSAYMAEITNKDSKLVTGNFYLTPRDIFTLNFANYIYLDGSLFRLNKITDYNASVPATCQVQLLKVINTTYQYVTFPPIIGSFKILWSAGNYLLSSGTDKINYQ